MSGILCVRDASGATHDRETFLAALRLLSPRGSAGESVRDLPGVCLGIRSPEPWPHAEGRDPLASGAGGKVVVAVDGRIEDGPDPETLAAGTVLREYLEHGEGCFARLRGVFAIVVWDARKERLWLARDPLGVRPLYFTAGAGRLLAASEIKSLLRLDPALR
jgi:asparagine synthase (glutamine-hydrolysing)